MTIIMKTASPGRRRMRCKIGGTCGLLLLLTIILCTAAIIEFHGGPPTVSFASRRWNAGTVDSDAPALTFADRLDNHPEIHVVSRTDKKSQEVQLENENPLETVGPTLLAGRLSNQNGYRVTVNHHDRKDYENVTGRDRQINKNDIKEDNSKISDVNYEDVYYPTEDVVKDRNGFTDGVKVDKPDHDINGALNDAKKALLRLHIERQNSGLIDGKPDDVMRNGEKYRPEVGESGNPGSSKSMTSRVPVQKKPRVIVYSCNKLSICGGWADRQKGVVSAYVLARMLGTDFRIDMPRPCDVTNFLLPNQVDWRLREGEGGESSERWGTRSDVEGIDGHGYTLVLRMLNSPALDLPELRSDRVFITWNMELVHLLRTHPLASSVPWLGSQVSLAEVYQHVLTALFAPAPRLQAWLSQLRGQRPPGSKLACAHVRMGGSPGFNDSETFNNMQGVRQLLDFLRQYDRPDQYRILVASDNRQVLDLAQQRFPRTLLRSPGPITHVDKYGGPDACAGLGHAVLDQSLLATCHVLVISESGLAKIAAFMRDTDENLFLFHDGKVSVFRRDMKFPNRIFW